MANRYVVTPEDIKREFMSVKLETEQLIVLKASGRTNQEIADCLNKSSSWVSSHLDRPEILEKLSLATKAAHEAVQSRFMRLGRKSADTLEELLDHEDPEIRLRASKQVIDGIGTLNLGKDAIARLENRVPTLALQVNFNSMKEQEVVIDELRKRRHA